MLSRSGHARTSDRQIHKAARGSVSFRVWQRTCTAILGFSKISTPSGQMVHNFMTGIFSRSRRQASVCSETPQRMLILGNLKRRRLWRARAAGRFLQGLSRAQPESNSSIHTGIAPVTSSFPRWEQMHLVLPTGRRGRHRALSAQPRVPGEIRRGISPCQGIEGCHQSPVNPEQ